jgi:hypothetical protein
VDGSDTTVLVAVTARGTKLTLALASLVLEERVRAQLFSGGSLRAVEALRTQTGHGMESGWAELGHKRRHR